ncbi:MAG: hypothetical protein FWC81_04120, partial [Coriobacteriia bacterium]|nr:hypothetical protein [Coriobacteriia bacterium]
SAIRRVTDLIPSTVRNILGIRSPSRVLAALGRDTMRGLIGGLDNLAPALMSTVSGIANDIADMMCLSGTISVAASSYPCGFIAADSLAGAGFSSAVAPQVTYEQNFYTPQANYYDLLAANRAAQKMMARL